MLKRKEVTDEQFDIAYKNKDYRKVIDSVTFRYHKLVDRDDLRSAGLRALLRCLSYHDDSYNQKFTTSLWRFVDWECKRELRKLKNKPQHLQLSLVQVDIPEKQEYNNEDAKFIRECVEQLPEMEKNIVTSYYFEGRTMEEIGKLNGFSKETARQKIGKSLKKLEEFIKRESSKWQKNQ